MLGELCIRSDKARLPVRGTKQRSLLAALTIRGNVTVSAEDLVLEIWGDEPPVGAENALQAHISRIRAILATQQGMARFRLRTRYPGYLFELPEGSVDSSRFRRHCVRAQAVKNSAPEQAAALYRAGLALWRGPALQNVPPGPIRNAEVRRLASERRTAVASLVELDLDLGRHLQVIPDLEQLVLEHPLEERFYAQLMVALTRSGRTGDALQVYQRARLTLAQEAGLSPSPALQRRMRMILHDSGHDDETS
ncbi:AfsR/SARP family transcriptional regulator [Actinomadura flavalba]|uniref:AfsR/SARP family transcriptional regulator n=1 Tax=Actinomadura flavalba TaxID=1120938 RepID=UPI00036FDB21|nr:AfsR/SARP family transcriptional regulator [Actinomadura flavalba]